jgi:hypothetical protein
MRKRNHDARGADWLVPDLAAVALEHVADGERRLLGAHLERLGSQRASARRTAAAAPREVELDERAVAAARNATSRTCMSSRRRSARRRRPAERVAVDLDPERLVDAVSARARAGQRLDAPARDARQVGEAHVLEREPAFSASA